MVARLMMGVCETSDELDILLRAAVVVSTTALPRSLTFVNVAMTTWLRKIDHGATDYKKKFLCTWKKQI